MCAETTRDGSLRDRISFAARKWYMPITGDLLRLCELHPLHRETDAQDLIRRSDKPALAYPTLVNPEPVLGSNPLELRSLFFSPLLLRLHYVAQLSTTDLRGNIDAKHCRLSHALGNLSILSALMGCAVRKIQELNRKDLNRCLPNKEEIIAGFTYAAMHDVFQGPFGHVLDSLRVHLVGPSSADRRLDKTLLHYMFSQALSAFKRENPEPLRSVEALLDILKVTIAKPLNVSLQFILEWICEASSPTEEGLSLEKTIRRHELRWLYELLEGPLDADRWDYLWRDTLHLGFTKNNRNITRLFETFLDELSVCWHKGQSRILVTKTMANRLGNEFFTLRRNLYRQVYESPEKRIVDSMLVRAIYLGLLDPRMGAPSPSLVMDFMNITDTELLSILETSPHPLAAHLARELRTYPVAHISWEYDISDDAYNSVMRSNEAAVNSFAFTKNGGNIPHWVQEEEDLPMILATAYSKLRAKGTFASVDTEVQIMMVAAILHCSILSTRIPRLLYFERLAWRLVRRELWEFDQSIIERIAESVSLRLSLLGLDVGALLKDCPPIFVSFPWLSASSPSGMKEIARELGEKKICVGEGTAVVEKTPAMLMPESKGEAYTLVAGYPMFIVSRLSENDRDTLDKAIQNALDVLIRSGCCLALPEEYWEEKYDTTIIRFITQTLKPLPL